MIDYLLLFTDEAAAKADSIVGSYGSVNPDTKQWSWRGDCCIPNVQVWDTRQDVAGQPSYLPGFWLVISVLSQQSALDGHGATQLIADRDAANSGASLAKIVIKTVKTLSDLQFFRLQPVFAGSNYPFGTQS